MPRGSLLHPPMSTGWHSSGTVGENGPVLVAATAGGTVITGETQETTSDGGPQSSGRSAHAPVRFKSSSSRVASEARSQVRRRVPSTATGALVQSPPLVHVAAGMPRVDGSRAGWSRKQRRWLQLKPWREFPATVCKKSFICQNANVSVHRGQLRRPRSEAGSPPCKGPYGAPPSVKTRALPRTPLTPIDAVP